MEQTQQYGEIESMTSIKREKTFLLFFHLDLAKLDSSTGYVGDDDDVSQCFVLLIGRQRLSVKVSAPAHSKCLGWHRVQIDTESETEY